MLKRTKKGAMESLNMLKIFFYIHFVVDIMTAIPLFINPEVFLKTLGWQVVDPLSARVVAAALFGIGIESFLVRNSGLESFSGMLSLKIIWSAAVIAGIGVSIFENVQNSPVSLWVILIIFIIFNILWIYWKIRLKGIMQNKKYSD